MIRNCLLIVIHSIAFNITVVHFTLYSQSHKVKELLSFSQIFAVVCRFTRDVVYMKEVIMKNPSVHEKNVA